MASGGHILLLTFSPLMDMGMLHPTSQFAYGVSIVLLDVFIFISLTSNILQEGS